MSHQSSHPTPHYLRFGPKIGVTVKNFARAATAARVTKRNAIERELWLGQFEVYSSFGYLGVFIGCRLSSRWSLMCCNGRNGCGNGPVFRGKVRRGVCFRSKFLATENAARGLFLNRISRKSYQGQVLTTCTIAGSQLSWTCTWRVPHGAMDGARFAVARAGERSARSTETQALGDN